VGTEIKSYVGDIQLWALKSDIEENFVGRKGFYSDI
jgi:hypothetical protein